jgi:hypothetical protein
MATSHAVSAITIPGIRIVAETAMVPSSGDSGVVISSFASDRSRVESGSAAATAYSIERRARPSKAGQSVFPPAVEALPPRVTAWVRD